MTSSSNSNSNNINNELSSFYSAFRADDSLIDIIPAFDYNSNSNSTYDISNDDLDYTNIFQSTLSATSIFGGSGMNNNNNNNNCVKAGLTYTVPIWMAMLLQQRSFATIVYPTDTWYNVSNLKYILFYEKQNVSLFHTTATNTTNDYMNIITTTKKSRRSHHDDDDDSNDDDDEQQQQHQKISATNDNYFLPSNYFELAMRFKASVSPTSNSSHTSSNSTTNTTTTTTANMDVLTLLIQDIYDIRMDKLRQQFQTLLYDTTKHNITPPTNPSSSSSTTPNRSSHVTDLIINVTGIGTQELSQIQSYVIPAMNDIYYLES